MRIPSFRIWLTLAGSLIAVGSVVAISGVWVWNFKFGLPASADKITRLNTMVAASAYIAAIIAAVFALIAYWQSSAQLHLSQKSAFCQPIRGDSPLTATLKPAPVWIDKDTVSYPSRGPVEQDCDHSSPPRSQQPSSTLLPALPPPQQRRSLDALPSRRRPQPTALPPGS